MKTELFVIGMRKNSITSSGEWVHHCQVNMLDGWRAFTIFKWLICRLCNYFVASHTIQDEYERVTHNCQCDVIECMRRNIMWIIGVCKSTLRWHNAIYRVRIGSSVWSIFERLQIYFFSFILPIEYVRCRTISIGPFKCVQTNQLSLSIIPFAVESMRSLSNFAVTFSQTACSLANWQTLRSALDSSNSPLECFWLNYLIVSKSIWQAGCFWSSLNLV